MPKQLVIGLGEIGTAIQTILGCDSFDTYGEPFEKVVEKGGVKFGYDVIHICFPFSKDFIVNVQWYMSVFGIPSKDGYKFPLVIIHSTVPVGTCDANGWVHSPVRGVHPELEKGIRTFVKFFGGNNADAAADLFRIKGITCASVQYAKNTEALKLWDTTIYGWNILLEKAIHEYCEKRGLDFEMVYSYANETYNQGYAALGHSEYSKYVLKDFPGPIGGHCVQENWELLDDPIALISKELHSKLSDS